ncbi:unnamed protein product, partial [Didymodactylos carnosus]
DFENISDITDTDTGYQRLTDYLCDEAEDIKALDGDDDVDYMETQSDISLTDSIEKDLRPLHLFSSKTTSEACEGLLKICRQAKISKATVNAILKFIASILPQPNYLPTNFGKLIKSLNITNRFTKIIKCSNCFQEIT